MHRLPRSLALAGFISLTVVIASVILIHASARADERTFTDSEGHTVTETNSTFNWTDADGNYVETSWQDRSFKDSSGNVVKTTHTSVTEIFTKKGGKKLRSSIKVDRRVPEPHDELNHYGETWSYTWTDHVTGESETESGSAHTDSFGEPFDGDMTVTKSKPSEKPVTEHYYWCDDCEEWHLEKPLFKIDPQWLKKLGELFLLDSDVNLRPISAAVGNGTGRDVGIYLPPIAAPGSEIMGTVLDPGNAGSKSVLIGLDRGSGQNAFFQAETGIGSHIYYRLPSDAVDARLFKAFDRGGQPDIGATLRIGDFPHLEGTMPLPHLPGGAGITEGNSAFLNGPGQGLVTLHTRGTDPLDTHALLNGSARNIRTLGTSDESYLGLIGPSVKPGRYTLTLTSDGKRLNSFPFDLVTLTADPIPPSHPGTVETVTVHVSGLASHDTATMDFDVSGAAQLATGGETVRVPVRNGVAQVQIRGTSEGQALVRFHLNVHIPNYWP